MTKARRVLLIVGGGIAAYKSLELVRLLAKSNIATTAILTEAGAQFVTPLSLAALTGNPDSGSFPAQPLAYSDTEEGRHRA